MNGIERLLRAVEVEFIACPTWQPLIENARRELAELQRTTLPATEKTTCPIHDKVDCAHCALIAQWWAVGQQR